ncbi:hypothetical protein GGR28_001330 [Lewinella aquimaris]|uniref:Plasmid pRiA4b Orf3-like domain-containing protein n=1 Tax=Neolewinella aquimaris TaxID=1835722 RepID=A0A840E698_9BACT|nr:plasmid pRiA4b ORF-3 family protein [Neolewinella aquimaris]MBB4078717.1 hypothetical protein [Neolewinella aquimaris]
MEHSAPYLLDDLVEAVRSRAGEHKKWTDALLVQACEAYATYFTDLQQDPHLEPPSSWDAEYDLLLLTLWDVIVDREITGVDDIWLEGASGKATSHEDLYIQIFRELIEEVRLTTSDRDSRAFLEADWDKQVGTPEDSFNQSKLVEEEVGIRFHYEPRADLPVDMSIILESASASAADIDTLIAEVVRLRRENPGSLSHAETELTVRLAVGDIAGAVTLAKELRTEFPESILIIYVLVEAARSGDTIASITESWGNPPDVRRAFPNWQSGISIYDYSLYEQISIRIDCSAGRYVEALARLERLIKLDLDGEVIEELLETYFEYHLHDQVMGNHVMPNTWEPPPLNPAAPRASQLVSEHWPSFADFVTKQAMRSSGMDDFDLDVPEGSYQIKVTLQGIRPPIWRRLIVPAAISLADLHRVIQAAMGWDDAHLHSFQTTQSTYSPEDTEYSDNYNGLYLNILMQKPKHKISYEYDFGDSWHHEILLEKVLPDPVDQVTCTAGKRACPPEDSGGIGGYYNMLQIMAGPETEDKEALRAWLGDDFEPEKFSVDEVNIRLRSIS